MTAGSGLTRQQERGARGNRSGARGSRRGAHAAAGTGCAQHAGAWRGRGARPRRAAGPAGCALGALGLFLTRFDSVLFVSQFLDMVRELGS